MRFNNGQGSENKYLYNGKEFQDDYIEGVNLDWYDYGATILRSCFGEVACCGSPGGIPF
jgi:hypothetical protein